jgi:primosomal protein N''
VLVEELREVERRHERKRSNFASSSSGKETKEGRCNLLLFRSTHTNLLQYLVESHSVLLAVQQAVNASYLLQPSSLPRHLYAALARRVCADANHLSSGQRR